MNRAESKNRIDKLITQIDELRYRYHVLNDPQVSDATYDSLNKELTELEEKFPDLRREDSPLQRIGSAPLDKFTKVEHKVRQWSFNDAFDEEEIYKWEERILKLLEKQLGYVPKLEYICELKIDGLHVVLTYEKGLLKLAATRGDGKIGEDVTQNVKTIQSIPLRLNKNIDLIVEGEVWMSEKQLAKINKQRAKDELDLYANPRNVAAGTLRQLDPKIVAERKLDCFLYDWSGSDQKSPDTQQEELEVLKTLGFKVNKHYKNCKNIKEVIEFWQEWEKKRDAKDYWLDGVVVKINERKIQETLGYVGKAPRWALAIKFAAEQVTTVIEDIVLQIGRLGTLTPVANLRPVQLAGTTVKRATLHNQDQIDRLDVRIGDTVILRKAGDIIPEIVEVLPKMRTGKEKKFKIPDTYQGIKVIRKEGEVGYRLADKNVGEIKLRQIQHLVSKKAFNIDGLGVKIVDQLLEVGLLKDASDIFKLKKSDLVSLERFAEKSADNLIASINQSKKISLDKFLYALGIAQVGEETAIDLSKNFNSLEKIKNLSLEEVQAISDIGPIVANSIYNYFHDKKNLELLEKFEKNGVQVEGVTSLSRSSLVSETATSRLQNKKILVTGTLVSLGRDEAKDAIRAAGGDVVSSVSKKTDYVVVGENPGSKKQKAEQLGVEILNEKQFLKLL